MGTTLTITALGEGAPVILVYGVMVDDYRNDPVLAEDQITPTGQHIVASGSGFVKIDTSYPTFLLELQRASNRVMQVTIEVSSTPDKLLDATKANDDRGGPWVKFHATQILNTETALVRWEVDAKVSRVLNQTVTAHRWTQQMTLDATGALTRTLHGSVHVARGTTGTIGPSGTIPTNTDWKARLPYADLFRRAIVPDLPEGYGWRRESQDFTMDETGTVLVYQVVDKRLAHDLPDGVRVGDMSFTYERNISSVGMASLHFSCDLETDLGMKLAGTPPVPAIRRLVQAASMLALARIDSNYKQVIIQKIRVTENNMLSGYGIRFELDAAIYPKSEVNPATATLVPLGFMIGNIFKVIRTLNRAVDPYGPYVQETEFGDHKAWGMIPHWLENNVDGMIPEASESMPTAAMFVLTGTNLVGTVSVTVTADAEGVSQMNSQMDGAFSTAQFIPPNDGDGFATPYGHSAAVTGTKIDSGLVSMSSMYLGNADIVYQIRKPRVYVTEDVEVSRANQAPGKAFRTMPVSSHLVSEGWKVAHGRYDPQGQRVFSGVYSRTTAVYDNGLGTSGFGTGQAPVGSIRTWGSPSQTVAASLSPATTGDSQNSLVRTFGAMADSRQAYAVSPPTFIQAT